MATDKNGLHPIVLAILDGWGLSEGREGNAIAMARTPNFDALKTTGPFTSLIASGPSVGLGEGQPGNPQAGYMTLGAGSPLMQPMLRVTEALRDEGPEPFSENSVFHDLAHRMRLVGGTVHLLGLIAPSSYSSHQNHLAKLAALFSHLGVDVRIHAFMDGIETKPQGGLLQLTEFLEDIAGAERASIATLMGRAYGFDDAPDEKLRSLALKTIIEGEGPRLDYPLAWLDQHYRKGLNDDRIPPMVSPTYHGLRHEDAVCLVNLCSDLGRGLLLALERESTRVNIPLDASLYTLTPLALHPQATRPFLAAEEPSSCLSEILSQAGLRQLLLTETITENNLRLHLRQGHERIFPGETLLLGETPPAHKIEKKPYLAADDLTAEAMNAISSKSHELVIVAYPNATVLGRRGNLRATVEAVEAMDKALGKLAQAVEKKGGLLIATATHGKADHMLYMGGSVSRATSHAPVPFLLAGAVAKNLQLRNEGTLADIAPTILHLLGLEAVGMSGRTLLNANKDQALA